MSTTSTINTADVLRGGFSGDVLRPAQPGYEEARRVFNKMIDRHPGLIARCTSTVDVAAAVSAAREHGLVVAVRGGGHSFSGLCTCDDGMVIDLRGLKSITVDPQARTARPAAACCGANSTPPPRRTGSHTPGGRVTTTGLGGFTTGGGYGWNVVEVRPGLRQPHLRRGRPRRRQRGTRQRATSTPTCSGASAAAAATSASSPSSSSGCTRSARSCSPDWPCSRSTGPRMSCALARLVRRRARRGVDRLCRDHSRRRRNSSRRSCVASPCSAYPCSTSAIRRPEPPPCSRSRTSAPPSTTSARCPTPPSRRPSIRSRRGT